MWHEFSDIKKGEVNSGSPGWGFVAPVTLATFPDDLLAATLGVKTNKRLGGGISSWIMDDDRLASCWESWRTTVGVRRSHGLLMTSRNLLKLEIIKSSLGESSPDWPSVDGLWFVDVWSLLSCGDCFVSCWIELSLESGSKNFLKMTNIC